MKHGSGWYVFCVDKGEARELRTYEEEIVNRYRFRQGVELV